jgi:hypothetical protein
MKAHEMFALCGLAMSISANAAETPSFGADQHNNTGQPIVITVRCSMASDTRVMGYTSERREALSRTDRPTASGLNGFVLLVPTGWWYKLVPAHERCAATVVAAPHRRFNR